MVDLNATIFPILGPVGTFINTIKVFVGGVFGIYLLILYFRWREYIYVRSMLGAIRKDLRAIAEHEGVKLEPVKKHHIIRLGTAMKNLFSHEKGEAKKTSRKKI